MNNTTLFLPLKAKWYDMIESGIKTEEYREIKPYWIKRLVDPSGFYSAPTEEDVNSEEFKSLDFDPFKSFCKVIFSYGYTKRKMKFECKGIHLGTGNPEWGAEPGKNYFVIKLGRRLK